VLSLNGVGLMDAVPETSKVAFVTLSLCELKSYLLLRAKTKEERSKIEAAIIDREAKGVDKHATGSALERQLNKHA